MRPILSGLCYPRASHLVRFKFRKPHFFVEPDPSSLKHTSGLHDLAWLKAKLATVEGAGPGASPRQVGLKSETEGSGKARNFDLA